MILQEKYIIIGSVLLMFIIIIIVIIILNNKKSSQQLQNTGQVKTQQTPSSVSKNMGNGNQGTNALPLNTDQVITQQTPTPAPAVQNMMGMGNGNQGINALPLNTGQVITQQTPAPVVQNMMGVGYRNQGNQSANASVVQNMMGMGNQVNQDTNTVNFTLPQFLPLTTIGSLQQYPTLGGIFPGSYPGSSQDSNGNYYGSFFSQYTQGATNQRIYCDKSNYTNARLYGTSGNTSNYLYVGYNFTLSFVNYGTVYTINLPLANPVCWSNNIPYLNSGCTNQITSDDNVFINLDSNNGIQFWSSSNGGETLWNFYYNIALPNPNVNTGSYYALVYDDINCNVYFATEQGNVYIYISVPTYQSLFSFLQPMSSAAVV